MAENCRQFISDKESGQPFFLYFATSDPHRSGQLVQESELKRKPNRFGNLLPGKKYPGIEPVRYDAAKVPVPGFLPDTAETRAELAQYYQACSRIDQGLARLVQILKEANVYDSTMIIFTSDHGMAFAGAKTNVYEAGLHVPFVVRDPYQKRRGLVSNALISHTDITPSILDFAGLLAESGDRPRDPIDPQELWQKAGLWGGENRSGGYALDRYHGRSWLEALSGEPQGDRQREYVIASHTFHEIQMYYPMRVYRDRKYKLIWNIAHKLDYPFASDLWAAPSWQAQWEKGMEANYGHKTVGQYLHRPAFELYDMQVDPEESRNLASDPKYQEILKQYQQKLRSAQKTLEDPWVTKWDYE